MGMGGMGMGLGLGGGLMGGMVSPFCVFSICEGYKVLMRTWFQLLGDMMGGGFGGGF